MLDFTLAICTYNGANRLPAVLGSVQQQIDADQIQWEVVVVDNNSCDRTPEVVKAYQSCWSLVTPLRYVTEPQQGLAFARNRAVAEAYGAWVAFLDDDTVPQPNWVAAAHQFAQQRPHIGAYGGQIHADFEVEPAAGIEKIAVFLAIVERGNQPYCYQPAKRMLPPGAGLVVRRQIWLDHAPSQPHLTGRTLTSMMAGEDLEVLAHIQKAGWEIWYNPIMELYHKIPQQRLELAYLQGLAWGIGLCRHHIRMVRTPKWQVNLLTPLYVINDLIRLLTHLLTSQSEPLVFRSVELRYRLATLLSPFYLLYQSVRPPAPVQK
jgi:glycosyltransferase involved in cell wall biosynthesis